MWGKLVATTQGWSARRRRFLHRVNARLAARAQAADGFVSRPEPRTIGSFARGRQLLAGNLLFAGYLVEAPDTPLWQITPPDLAFAEELHGFAWLDDLETVGDAQARRAAQKWTQTWIGLYGRGSGPGWTPDLTGRRLIRWINHAVFLLNGQDSEASQAYFRALASQTVFLGRRWHATVRGLPRFEALTGLLYAGLALQGMERHVQPACDGLSRECTGQIDEQGGIPTRNPEDLLEILTLLCWASGALTEAGRKVPPPLRSAIERIAPALRTLRHADGGLIRAHGGGRGLDGRLDNALALAAVRPRSQQTTAMGFDKLTSARTSVIVDCAMPPTGRASVNAHAGVLGFELTSGRRPLIVSCGSGSLFGPEWHRAGRATPSHSTLTVDGLSSARLVPGSSAAGLPAELLVDGPRHVLSARTSLVNAERLEASHDGYRHTHGLTHARTLELASDGRGLAGEDLLLALDERDQRRFDQRMDQAHLQGIPFSLRFHIHPDVDVALDLGGSAVSLALRSGEIWVFRHDASTRLSLSPSVFMERRRLKPRACQQIVLAGDAMEPTTRVRWSLAKAQDTPYAVRDTAAAPVTSEF